MARAALFLLVVLAVSGVARAQESAGGESPLWKLTTIRTVCVESFAGEPPLADTAKEMAFAALFSGKRFTVTERCDKADAVLKGAVMQRSAIRVRAEGEGAGFGVAGGAATTTEAAIGAAVGGSEENLYSRDQQTHASVTVRLVDADGLVLWAHTQESSGGKINGPLADAVERAFRQLARDVERAEKREKGVRDP